MAVDEEQGLGTLQIIGDPEVDLQVSTARRFPRSITTFMQKAQQMATLTPEIAASCIYALPRKENGKAKTIEGPSARLAEICASAWGNIRAEGKVLGYDDEFVTARGTAWDVESNVAIAYEVKRRITDSRGNRYSADMIGVTGNAGASIALRNAILKAIPTPFWKPIYNACRKVIAGDAKTFSVRRDASLHEFAVMGVTEDRVCAALGIKGRSDITFEHLVLLAGFQTAIRDGESTIEDVFPESGGLGGGVQAGQRKSQQAPPAGGEAAAQDRAGAEARSREMPSGTTGAVGGSAAASQSSAGPSNVGTIIDVVERDGGAVVVKLSTGLQAATKDAEIIASAKALKESGRRVEVTTKAASSPKFAPVITELSPVADEAGQ